MQIEVLSAKLHGLTVTRTDLKYEGSITLDMDLVDSASMHVWQKVQILNLNNGARFDTYIIPGERGSKDVCLNGPSARLAQPGDNIIVLAYGMIDQSFIDKHRPTVVLVNKDNSIKCQK